MSESELAAIYESKRKAEVERVAAWIEAVEERAAIMEYDGGLPRDEAERRARELLEETKPCDEN